MVSRGVLFPPAEVMFVLPLIDAGPDWRQLVLADGSAAVGAQRPTPRPGAVVNPRPCADRDAGAADQSPLRLPARNRYGGGMSTRGGCLPIR